MVGLHAYGGGSPDIGWGWNLGFEPRDLAIGDKRLGYRLIHVVVFIRRKTVYEVDIRLPVCEVLAACVKSGIVGAWDGVTRKPSAWVLVNYTVLRGCLTDKVLGFGHACVTVTVGIIVYCCFLVAGCFLVWPRRWGCRRRCHRRSSTALRRRRHDGRVLNE